MEEQTTQQIKAQLIKNFELLEISYSRSAEARRNDAVFANRKGDGRSRPKVARLLLEAAAYDEKAATCAAYATQLKKEV